MAKQTVELPSQLYSNLKFYDVFELLDYLQEYVSVAKGKYSEYGQYSYYSVSDIYTEVKKYLKHIRGASLYFKPVQDELVGDWHNKRATVVLRYRDDDNVVTEVVASSTARESETEAKKSSGQVSGSTESYAKKYALNSLLLIDEDNDDDSSAISYDWSLSDEEKLELEKKKANLIERAKKNLNPTEQQIKEWENADYVEVHKSVTQLYQQTQGVL